VPPQPDWVAVGIGDDAAVVEPARGTLDVVTTDTLVEGVHFDRAFGSAADIGHKALAVNLSDLAAMGATPRSVVLSLVLPPTLPTSDLDQLIEGLLTLASSHDVALIGGNITRTEGPLVVGLTAYGAVRRRRVLTRDGGRPGDELWVTGWLGAAAAGLARLRTPPRVKAEDKETIAACIAQYRRPNPRVRIGTLLGRNRVARAAIDLSDGLADGLSQLARASRVGVVVEGPAVPVHEDAARWFIAQGQDPLIAALAGGDDYEILLAVPRTYRRRLAVIARLFRGIPLTRIGTLTSSLTLVLNTPQGPETLPTGYAHFASS